MSAFDDNTIDKVAEGTGENLDYDDWNGVDVIEGS
jgi:hypothetical protein